MRGEAGLQFFLKEDPEPREGCCLSDMTAIASIVLWLFSSNKADTVDEIILGCQAMICRKRALEVIAAMQGLDLLQVTDKHGKIHYKGPKEMKTIIA